MLSSLVYLYGLANYYFLNFRECLKFSFGIVIQRELDEVKELHNLHYIRPYPNQDCPNGIPNLLYELPERHGMFLCIYMLQKRIR